METVPSKRTCKTNSGLIVVVMKIISSFHSSSVVWMRDIVRYEKFICVFSARKIHNCVAQSRLLFVFAGRRAEVIQLHCTAVTWWIFSYFSREIKSQFSLPLVSSLFRNNSNMKCWIVIQSIRMWIAYHSSTKLTVPFRQWKLSEQDKQANTLLWKSWEMLQLLAIVNIILQLVEHSNCCPYQQHFLTELPCYCLLFRVLCAVCARQKMRNLTRTWIQSRAITIKKKNWRRWLCLSAWWFDIDNHHSRVRNIYIAHIRRPKMSQLTSSGLLLAGWRLCVMKNRMKKTFIVLLSRQLRLIRLHRSLNLIFLLLFRELISISFN